MTNQLISHYKIIKKIGNGGMGEVYLAEDIRLKRNVALKILSNNTIGDEEEKVRFIKEAQAAAALNHHNICTVYDIDEDDNRTFIAMEFIDGERLNDVIKKTPLSIQESVRITVQIAEGLREASLKGIIHRDIKTSNILLTKNNLPKITDFGLAKLIGSSNITRPGTIFGTPAFMSPEQARGKEVDLRTDIWSLGVVLYNMLTGNLPFRGNYDQAVIYSILHEEPIPINESITDITNKLEKIVYKMLVKNPDDRYQNFDELIEDLEKMAIEEGFLSKIKFTKRPFLKRKKIVFLLSAGFLLTIIISLLFVLITLPGKQAESVNIKLIVLPFENLGDPEDAYFTEGVYDETISRLSWLNGLSVVPRRKAAQYNDKNIAIAKLKDELDVDYVIEGTVRWNKSRISGAIRMILELIDAKNEILVWSEKYDGQLKDIFKIQTNIAESVAKQLDIKILEPERKAISEVPTYNMDAYDTYRRGRKIFVDAQSLPREEQLKEYKRALQVIEGAIKLDSLFYGAYIFLSHSYSYLYFYGYDQTGTCKQRVKEILDKILKLRPEDSGAKWQLAVYYYRMEEDYQRSYDITRELYMEYPKSYTFWMGIVERRLGMWEEALKHLKEWESSSPKDDDAPLTLGALYTITRKFDLADKAYDRSLRNHPQYLDAVYYKSFNYILWDGDLQRASNVWEQLPDKGKTNLFWLFYYRLDRNYSNLINSIQLQKDNFINVQDWYFIKYTELSLVYYLLKQPDKVKIYADSAKVFLEKMQKEKPGDANLLDVLGLTYALLGQKEEAISTGLKAVELFPMEKDAMRGTIHLTYLAKIYSILDEKDKAIKQIEYLLSVPSEVSTAYLKMDPLWDNLRHEKSFQKLELDN